MARGGGKASVVAFGSGGATSTPGKRTAPVTKPVDELRTVLERWSPAGKQPKGVRLDFDEDVACNRPSCTSQLEHFIPPGTKQKGGVTYAKCKNPECAGGGCFLAFTAKCTACNTYIKEGSLPLSLAVGDKKYQNQRIHNCLLDKVPGTENARFALKALPKDIRKTCTTCVQFDPTIKEGVVLLSTANVGDVQFYSCCGSKRKDFLRVVFVAQGKRHADFLAKESGTSAEKKAKLEEKEAAVGFATLAPDSDDEL